MRTLLLVEDSAPLRKTLQSILEASGFSVIACSDGQVAIEQASHRDVDVMLVDYRMPGPSGAEVTKIIRERHPRACIIGMSLEDRKNSFLAAGADDFLLKPFAIGDVIRIAETCVFQQEGIGK